MARRHGCFTKYVASESKKQGMTYDEGQETFAHGKTCVLAGVTSGFGIEVAIALAIFGAKRIVFLCRSKQKGESVKAKIQASANVNDANTSSSDPTSVTQTSVEYKLVDFTSITDTIKVTNEIKSECDARSDQIDILMLNNGTMTNDMKTAEGLDSMYSINVVSMYTMYTTLRDHLSSKARIVLTGSTAGSGFGYTFDISDLVQGTNRGAASFKHYARCKTAVMCLGEQIAALEANDANDIARICIVTHPGFVYSKLGSEVNAVMNAIFTPLKKLITRNVETGALLNIFACVCNGITHEFAGAMLGHRENLGRPNATPEKLSNFVSHELCEQVWEACGSAVAQITDKNKDKADGEDDAQEN